MLQNAQEIRIDPFSKTMSAEDLTTTRRRTTTITTRLFSATVYQHQYVYTRNYNSPVEHITFVMYIHVRAETFILNYPSTFRISTPLARSSFHIIHTLIHVDDEAEVANYRLTIPDPLSLHSVCISRNHFTPP